MKKNKGLIISIALSILFIVLLFATKGLYPFGKNVYNVIDFDQAYTPVYYKFWDIVHGNGSLFFDWNLGGGLNSFNSILMNGLEVPTSWIILLFPRDLIPYGMNIVLILKILTMTLCSYIAIDKLFNKMDYKYKILMSLFYTFSGWTSIMMSSLLYIDAVSLFPLFVLAYYKFIKEGNYKWFIIILTSVLIISYYMAWMYLFFIFGITIITPLVLDIKDKKKKCVQVLLMVLVSFGLSMITFLPSFYQVMTSYRMSSTFNFNISKFTVFSNKLIHILPLGILFVISFKQFFVKKDKKINLWFILMLIYTLIGLFIEPINLLWHTGSYSDLPFRYSYIPTFILILSSSYYLTNNLKINNKFNIANLISTICLFIIYIVMFFLFKDVMKEGQIALNIESYAQVGGLVFLFILSIISTLIIFRNDKKSFKYLIIGYSILILFTFSYMYINSESYVSSLTNVKISKDFKLKNDNYNYVDSSEVLGINFPYILDRPSMQNKLHFIKEDEAIFRDVFRYGGMGSTFIASYYGNYFSNYIMMNKYYISLKEMNNNLYKLIDKKGDFYYYESLYNLNYIIPYDGEIYNDVTNFIDDSNKVYKILFNEKDNIINKVSIEKDDNSNIIKLKKDSTYYIEFSLKDDYEYFMSKLRTIPNSKNFSGYAINDDTIYAYFDVLDSSEFIYDTDKYKQNILMGYISHDKFLEFSKKYSNKYDVKISNNKNRRTYEINLDSDKSILIPVNYDDNFIIKVNGENVKYKKNIYNMFSIDLKEGNNVIEMIYYPKYIKEGIMISIITLALLIVFVLSNKHIHYLDNKYVLYPLFSITVLVGIAFILKVYVLSWLTKIIALI